MSKVTDAIFFLHDDKVIKEMFLSEFEALLDGVVDIPEFKNKKIQAVQAQITEGLKIKGLVFFIVGFNSAGNIVADWNLPINQLLQSAGRGPDLGAGAIRLVCKRQCTVPWHQESLWDPKQTTLEVLIKTVQSNRLGIVEDEDAWSTQWDEGFDDIPIVAPVVPPTLTAEPPILTAAIPVVDVPLITPSPVVVKAENKEADITAFSILKKEFAALQAATSVKIDKLQKDNDALKEKNSTLADSLKKQIKEHVENLTRDFQQDLEKKDKQIAFLKTQFENEQKRYTELKEQQAEQAIQYHYEREELEEQLQKNQDIDDQKLNELKTAFKKELYAKVDAETSKVNEALAMREVELFYREEQLLLVKNELAQVKTEKQVMMKGSGSNILQALEDNDVTFVAFHVGVGHVTVAADDIGRYLDERTAYLADRCNVSVEEFTAWQNHYNNPVCCHIEADGHICSKKVARIDLVSKFIKGQSDMCDAHQHTKINS